MCSCAELAVKQAASPRMLPDDPTPYERMVVECDREMRKLARKLASDGNIDAFHRGFDQIIFDFHYRAHILGQEHAGNVIRIGLANVAGSTARDIESQWVQGLISDLHKFDPRYFKEGEWDERGIMNRLRLYQGKMRGTANVGFVDASPINSTWLWTLGGAEEHCLECPYIADNGPYSNLTLYTTPGAGDTPCLGNCKCHLTRDDGRQGILPAFAL